MPSTSNSTSIRSKKESRNRLVLAAMVSIASLLVVAIGSASVYSILVTQYRSGKGPGGGDGNSGSTNYNSYPSVGPSSLGAPIFSLFGASTRSRPSSSTAQTSAQRQALPREHTDRHTQFGKKAGRIIIAISLTVIALSTLTVILYFTVYYANRTAPDSTQNGGGGGVSGDKASPIVQETGGHGWVYGLSVCMALVVFAVIVMAVVNQRYKRTQKVLSEAVAAQKGNARIDYTALNVCAKCKGGRGVGGVPGDNIRPCVHDVLSECFVCRRVATCEDNPEPDDNN